MKEIIFKGLKGLVIENTNYKVIIIPELGGKIASLFHKYHNFELMYQYAGDPYTIPDQYGNFGAYDMSGFDDCWPSIDKGDVKYDGKLITYPDHGDTWFSPFTYQWIGEELELTYNSELMPYTFVKHYTLSDDGLKVNYTITNNGSCNIEGFYTAHGLMNCEEDMEFIFPKDTKEVVNVVTEGNKTLGAYQSLHPYPSTKDTEGNDFHLNKTQGPVGKCEKYYSTSPVSEGKCGAYYPRIGATFTMTFDKDKLPYFGLWLNERSPESYNYALEPTSGYYDSMTMAKKSGKYNVIKPGECFNFNLGFSIK